MNRLTQSLLILGFICPVVVAYSAVADEQPFFVGIWKTGNRVLIRPRLQANCSFDPKESISPIWQIFEDKEQKTWHFEEVEWYEKMVVRMRSTLVSPFQMRFVLGIIEASYIDLPLNVYSSMENGICRTYATVQYKSGPVVEVSHVENIDASLSGVKSFDVVGVDAQTGASLKFTVKPDKPSLGSSR